MHSLGKRRFPMFQRLMDRLKVWPVAVSLCDAQAPDSPIIYVNDKFCDQTRYARSDIVGNTWQLLYPPDIDLFASVKIHKAIKMRKHASISGTCRKASGEDYHSLLFIKYLYLRSGHKLLLGCHFEVDENLATSLRSQHEFAVEGLLEDTFVHVNPIYQMRLETYNFRAEALQTLVETCAVPNRRPVLTLDAG